MRKSWGAPPSDTIFCPHPSTLTLFHLLPFPISLFLPLIALVISFIPISFFPLTPFLPLCPALTCPSCLFPQIVAYRNQSCSVVPPQDRAKAALPSPLPPASSLSLDGGGGNRALPSDYTGGAGLEYSPEGRQLSISDNC